MKRIREAYKNCHQSNFTNKNLDDKSVNIRERINSQFYWIGYKFMPASANQIACPFMVSNSFIGPKDPPSWLYQELLW